MLGSLDQAWNRAVGRFLFCDSVGQTASGSWSGYRLEIASWFYRVRASVVGYSVGTLVGALAKCICEK